VVQTNLPDYLDIMLIKSRFQNWFKIKCQNCSALLLWKLEM